MAGLPFGQPYPLRRLFIRYILPGLVLLLMISAVLAVLGARQVAEGVYLVAAAGVPSLILLALTLVMARLVVLAQRNIDGRAALVADLRARLERLLSGAASQAVHRAVSAGGGIPSVRTRCTLLYSDVRDFTSFSEVNEPERVVGLLNQSMTIIVDAITRAGAISTN